MQSPLLKKLLGTLHSPELKQATAFFLGALSVEAIQAGNKVCVLYRRIPDVFQR